MGKLRVTLIGAALVVVLVLGAHAASADTIVVNNDEWTLGNSPGFAAPSDPGTFATNLASYFTGGGTGSFHAYSTNFGLTGTQLASAITGAGHTWSTGTGIAWTLPNLLTYDGIFLGGNTVPDLAVLAAYVNAGGNVYLMAGTAASGWSAATEAAYWNTFLNPFGLGYADFYNGIEGHIPISSPHAIFAGVSHLYQNNGNNTLDIAALDPRSSVLVTAANGAGLFAIYESNPVPEPTSLALFGLGAGALALRRRRRRIA